MSERAESEECHELEIQSGNRWDNAENAGRSPDRRPARVRIYSGEPAGAGVMEFR
jgi:hypothetical protein